MIYQLPKCGGGGCGGVAVVMSSLADSHPPVCAAKFSQRLSLPESVCTCWAFGSSFRILERNVL